MAVPKVFLSAGHGGSDPGAVAYNMQEKNINLAIMLACNEVLCSHGIETVLSRTKDENDPVTEEVKEANASKADLAVSFHTNAGGGDGFEAFYYNGSEKGKYIASLCEKYVKQIGQNSRGLKTNNLKFTRDTNMIAVLVESFFVDNDNDNNIGDTIDELKALGVAYAKAILEYFNIKYIEPKTTSGKVYRVQLGAYRNLSNAENMLKAVKLAGFTDAIITSD